MNKTKMILAGTGGVIGVIVLLLAFLVWQAFSAKTAAMEGDDEERIDGLETVLARAQSLSRKPVYPCAASVSAIEANQSAVDEWSKESLQLAARGDRFYAKTSAPKFKTFLVSDAKRLADLPGAVGGKLVKPDFAFGPFKDYITEGKMPSEAELVELQRRWDDVATVTEMLSTNGIAELLDVQFKAPAAEAAGAKDKAKANKRKPAKAKTEVKEPLSFAYVFTFAARPSAFTRVLNQLAASERFVTVEDFEFSRPKDVIAEALGGDEKKAAEAQTANSRRNRRVRRGNAEAAQQEQNKEVSKNGLVTDPLLDAPMTVTMTVSVHDFRSLEESEPEQEKGDSK